MPCRHLNTGPIPHRDQFARTWRETVAKLADLIPKAPGLANGEEGRYPRFPYQANYIKGLTRDIGSPDDVDPQAYCAYLRILNEARRRVSNRLEDIGLEGMRRQTNPQGGLPVSLSGPDSSGINLNLFSENSRSLRPAPRIDGQAPVGGDTCEHENTAEIIELYWMALLRDLPFRRWVPGGRLPNPPNHPNRDWTQLELDGATIDEAVKDLNRFEQVFC